MKGLKKYRDAKKRTSQKAWGALFFFRKPTLIKKGV
jgi:hypothetical protein